MEVVLLGARTGLKQPGFFGLEPGQYRDLPETFKWHEAGSISPLTIPMSFGVALEPLVKENFFFSEPAL